MNAHTVWQVWRRIMREPELQHVLFDGEPGPQALAGFGLHGEEQTAALAYARQADRARWFVVNYRYRLANSFLNALESGAPMVLRALLAQGADPRALGEQFLALHGWKDYGPFVYSYCLEALDFLAGHECSAAPRGLRDLIGLERAGVALLIHLAAPANAAAPLAPGLIGRGDAAAHYASAVGLSAWLRDKKQIGRSDLAPANEQYLVYLPTPDSALKFSLLPARAADIYLALFQPCLPSQLPDVLAGLGCVPHTAQDDALLTVLANYGAIRLPAKE